jgi:hypothetical protein
MSGRVSNKLLVRLTSGQELYRDICYFAETEHKPLIVVEEAAEAGSSGKKKKPRKQNKCLNCKAPGKLVSQGQIPFFSLLFIIL